MSLTVGSLFAGIGGMDLGFERAGCQIVWQVELDEWCRRVLAKHWPGVHRHDDIKTFEGRPCDIICGGFPCQDLSYAGFGAGLDGDRSGLWHEMLRVIRLVRPRYVLVENVSALLNRGMGVVVGGLAQIGYDCEWDCIPACAVGAPHRRDRVWIVAYPVYSGRRKIRPGRLVLGRQRQATQKSPPAGIQEDLPIPGCELLEGGQSAAPDNRSQGGDYPDWWAVEPDVGRVAHGVPSRVDRLRGLGNAVVPQVVQCIAERIVAIENQSLTACG